MSQKKATLSRGVSLGGVPSTPKRKLKIIHRGMSTASGTATAAPVVASSTALTRPASSIKQPSLSEKSGVQIVDPGQWLLWCEENKVIGSINKIPLEIYEVECFRRYFNTLKFSENDDGVHPQTLADAMLQAEIFPTLNDSLHFAQKLKAENNIGPFVTYTEILSATQCRSNYKRNKIRSFIKFVSTSELFSHLSTSTKDGGEITVDLQSQSSKDSCLELGSPLSVVNISDFSESQRYKGSATLESVVEDTVGAVDNAEVGKGNEVTASRNIISETLSQFVSNATGLIGSMFEKSPPGEPTSVVPQPKRDVQRKESGESVKSFQSLKKYFSRSCSRSPVNSTYEPSRSVANSANNTSNSNVVSVHDPPSPPSTSPKSPKSKLAIRPVLKKMDSGETRIRPAVKFKRAAMKIYVADQVIHLFKSKNCRVAAGFEDIGDEISSSQRLREVNTFAEAAGLSAPHMTPFQAKSTELSITPEPTITVCAL